MPKLGKPAVHGRLSIQYLLPRFSEALSDTASVTVRLLSLIIKEEFAALLRSIFALEVLDHDSTQELVDSGWLCLFGG